VKQHIGSRPHHFQYTCFLPETALRRVTRHVMDEDQIASLRTAPTEGSLRSSKTFFSSIISKERKHDQKEPPKGRQGLTTLYEPPNPPIVDLIFVHGLNGGSQSTWTKNDISTFWPKEWLKEDAHFADACRIHTFGYNSGVSEKSVLSVADFSHKLLAAIHDAPTIPRWQKVCSIVCRPASGCLGL
jgi:hypothetical protein